MNRAALRSLLAPLLGLAGTVGIYCLEHWVAERTWLTWLLVECPQFLFLLIPLILFGASLRGCIRRRTPALIWIGGSVSLVAFLLSCFCLQGLRLHSQADQSTADLRLMTYNVNKWSATVPSVCAAIRSQSPDIVCLQEAGDYFYSPASDALLQKELPDYRIVRRGEIVIATRLPVTGIKQFALPEDASSRPALCVTVLAHQEALDIVSVHFSPVDWGGRLDELPSSFDTSNRARMEQADELIRLFSNARVPTVVCGDCNLPAQGLTYSRLCGSFADAFDQRGSGFGYTLTSTFPYERIDHVFLGAGVEADSMQVPYLLASDHRPLIAEIWLKP